MKANRDKPECEECDSEKVKKVGYVYEEPISRKHNKSPEGAIYNAYECEDCGNRFKIEQNRKVIGRQRLANNLSILLIDNS